MRINEPSYVAEYIVLSVPKLRDWIFKFLASKELFKNTLDFNEHAASSSYRDICLFPLGKTW